jgi:hypothetical protein
LDSYLFLRGFILYFCYLYLCTHAMCIQVVNMISYHIFNFCCSTVKRWVPLMEQELLALPSIVLDTTLCDKFSVTSDRSVVVGRHSCFFHQYNWPPWYNWNIVERDVKYHNHRHTWWWAFNTTLNIISVKSYQQLSFVVESTETVNLPHVTNILYSGIKTHDESK